MHYRVHRICTYLGLSAATQPQLVNLAYSLNALPSPEPGRPLVLKAAEYQLVRTLAAGGTIGMYARKQGLTRFQVNYLARKVQRTLDAATLPALVRRAWERQVLGPTQFAADMARMHAQQLAEPDLGRHVIVPLTSGYRLALPAQGFHHTRHLDVPDTVEARAAARFLSGRSGYFPLRITAPEYQGGPFRVSWGRQQAMSHTCSRDTALTGQQAVRHRPERGLSHGRSERLGASRDRSA
ncbi:hypothetical protein [Streptomyces decoyicus]|uniref:hypothetical protein n=1 Tax=Streptomyces decoyicus TaxID=249567 RepID=UPI0036662719